MPSKVLRNVAMANIFKFHIKQFEMFSYLYTVLHSVSYFGSHFCNKKQIY